jgi:soluble lytic murein transglycosylase
LGNGQGAAIVDGIMGCGMLHHNGEARLLRHLIHIAPESLGSDLCSFADGAPAWSNRDGSTLRIVGLRVAESKRSQFTLAHSMPEVLAALDVDIVGNRSGYGVLLHAENGKKNSPSFEAVSSATVQTPAFTAKPLVGAATHVLAAVLLFLSVTSFSFQEVESADFQEARVDRLFQEIQSLQAAAKLDSSRERSIRKITAIISYSASRMPSLLKQEIAGEIYEMSLKYPNLDVELICATITHESGRSWNPRAVSPVGAMGLMQIMPSTGMMLAQEEGILWTRPDEILFDPLLNIRLGCRYLSTLVGAYSVDGGLAAYNGGRQRAERWVRNGRAEGILHEETAYYVPAIMKIYEQYRRMNG